MRFHFGVSFNFKTLIKFILPVLVALAFFFSDKIFSNALTDTEGANLVFDDGEFTIYRAYTSTGYRATYSWDFSNKKFAINSREQLNQTIIPYYLGTGFYHSFISGFKLSFPTTNFEKDKYYTFHILLKNNNNFVLNSKIIEYLSDPTTVSNYITVSNQNLEFISGLFAHNEENFIDGTNDFNLEDYALTFKANENFQGIDIVFGSIDKQTSTDTNIDLLKFVLKFNSSDNRFNNKNASTHGILFYTPQVDVQCSIVPDNPDDPGNSNFDEDIYNSITDSDVNSSSAQDFFNSFSDTDHGGLSSIITAPLRLIRQFTSSTCTPPQIPILGKTISLPCGDELFWNREDVSTFKSWWNMFWGGLIAYNIAKSLFFTIKDLKDPDSDKVEVLDL